MRRLSVGLLALGLTGCSLLLSDSDDGPDPGRLACPAAWAPLRIVACTDEDLTPADFSSGMHVIDTTAVTVSGPSEIGGELRVVNTHNGVEVVVLLASRILIPPGAILRAVGERPLILAAGQRILVAGIIDAGSGRDTRGAGAAGTCSGGTGGSGANLNDDGGGGAGGSFGSSGGSGGSSSTQGGGLATPSDVDIAELRAGCDGGDGGDAGSSGGGPGGHGGGAVVLTAFEAIGVAGLINAGGGGGGGAQTTPGGGGGGGSGGLIELEAPQITVEATGQLATNGGGGGEGGAAGCTQADPGDDATSAEQAAGGLSGSALCGGGGGAGAVGGDGEPGTTGPAGQGGGGGGGGVGVVSACAGSEPTVDGAITGVRVNACPE